MAEIRCRSCSAAVPLPPGSVGSWVVVECAFCGSQFGAAVPEPTGFETISYEPAPTESVGESAVSSAGPGHGIAAARPSSGTALLIRGQEVKTKAQPEPPRTIRRANLGIEGSQGAHMPLTGPRTEVGRKGAHVVIADPALSASHFAIEAKGDSFFVRDLDSSNGTRLNGHKVRSARLKSGDTIHAGETTFSFRIEEVIPWDDG